VSSHDALDDTDPMPFGKYKGTAMQDVPASYLLWLWTKRPLQDDRVELYIKKSLDALRMECPDWTE
jgi:uncharacterized protein (DUF3820 family)